MTLTEESRSTRRKTCHITTLFTINLTWTDRACNPKFYERDVAYSRRVEESVIQGRTETRFGVGRDRMILSDVFHVFHVLSRSSF
jgi:hypothetical protein